MTLKIDFDNKTVEVDNSTRIEDIVDALQSLDLEWREFSVKPVEGTKIMIVERKTVPQYVPCYPIQPATIPNNPWWINPVIC